MGNGANSRPENAVVTQRHVLPSAPNDFIASQQTGFNGYPADAVNGFDQRHYYQSMGSSVPRNGVIQSQSGSYGYNPSDFGYYATNGPSVAPTSTSYSRSHQRPTKSRHETSHQSALSVHHHPKKGKSSSQGRNNYRNGYENPGGRGGWEVDGSGGSNSDEILFEVFHCIQTGTDYNVINVDGVRYLVNSWDAAQDLQPFPEEWYQHGYIEGQRPVTGNYADHDQGSFDGDGQSNDSWVPRWEDDRMGMMEHPTRGLMTTYFEENKVNVLHVYDHKSGSWFKMPLSWELHIPDVSSRVSTVQEAFPDWEDQFEILALLRQCNYDLDEVTNIYISLLTEDVMGKNKKPGSKRQKGRSGSSQEHAAEAELLKERIEKLEEQLREKESQLEESKAANEDLKARLKSSEETARKLQTKGECLQLEIEELKSAPEPEPVLPVIEVVQPVVEKVQPTIEVVLPVSQPIPQVQPVIPTPPPPKAPTISKETCRNIKSTVRLFSRMLVELKNCFSGEMEGIASIMDRAQSSLRKMKDVDQGSSKELVELRALYHREVMQRKLLYNQLQELRGNIRVFCRCRYDPKADNVFTFASDQDLNVVSASGQKKTFRFDRVFSPSSTQEEVFQDTLPLITSCVDGYNVCIMAYGQTGAGKTYTMMGTDKDPGVNIRSILELLRVCDERTTVDYSMCVSMVEVYNETVRDLLSESSGSQHLNIQMRNKQLVITDVTEIEVKLAADIKSIMEKGDMNRSVGATKMNTNSSRSHLLLLLRLQGTDKVTNAITRGTLTLVDLAGSERISKTEATGQRLVEAAAINKSLSALGQVFSALRTNAMHVPYRNSKLTQLMQGSLGGDGKACLFVNVSPLASNLSETVSTLQFGSAAKQVQLGKATQNVTPGPKKH